MAQVPAQQLPLISCSTRSSKMLTVFPESHCSRQKCNIARNCGDECLSTPPPPLPPHFCFKVVCKKGGWEGCIFGSLQYIMWSIPSALTYSYLSLWGTALAASEKSNAVFCVGITHCIQKNPHLVVGQDQLLSKLKVCMNHHISPEKGKLTKSSTAWGVFQPIPCSRPLQLHV